MVALCGTFNHRLPRLFLRRLSKLGRCFLRAPFFCVLFWNTHQGKDPKTRNQKELALTTNQSIFLSAYVEKCLRMMMEEDKDVRYT